MVIFSEMENYINPTIIIERKVSMIEKVPSYYFVIKYGIKQESCLYDPWWSPRYYYKQNGIYLPAKVPVIFSYNVPIGAVLN